MTDILEEIVRHKRWELEQFKELLPERELHRQTEALLGTEVPSIHAALKKASTGIIAEFKRKSPSKGWIHEDGRADIIPLAYQNEGAAAVSILTDSHYFGGEDSFISTARKTGVEIPILYKNFIVDEYQLFQARLCGASAVLLIAAAQSLQDCRQLRRMARELQLEVLLEMHHEKELDYAEIEPELYGINNRHLGTFVTDVSTSFQLAEKLPREGLKVSESGISDAQTVLRLKKAGFEGFLMGECFMKEADPGQALHSFLSQIDCLEKQIFF